MGRVANADGTTEVHTSGLDRFGTGANDHQHGARGDSSFGTSGTGTSLSAVATGNVQAPPLEKAFAQQEVILHDIWFQLSPRDRQSFGHRFSDMVLKAFGLRPAQEVKS